MHSFHFVTTLLPIALLLCDIERESINSIKYVYIHILYIYIYSECFIAHQDCSEHSIMYKINQFFHIFENAFRLSADKNHRIPVLENRNHIVAHNKYIQTK